MLHLWFLLDIDNVGWFDFIIKCEQLFLRNIYSADELKKLGIQTEEKYTEDGDICDEVRSFLVEDLHDCYSTLKELREDIYHVSVPKRKFSSEKYFLH